jgi:hypothetical protein
MNDQLSNLRLMAILILFAYLLYISSYININVDNIKINVFNWYDYERNEKIKYSN